MKKFSYTTRKNSERVFQNKNIRQALVVGAVLLLLIFSFPKLLSYVSYVVFTPWIKLESYFRESNSLVPSYLRDRNELIEEINRLGKELAFKDHTDGSQELLLAENALLMAHNPSKDRIIGNVLARPGDLPYDVMMIDVGTEDGVVKNAPVYAGADQAIGYIAETYARDSLVVLATSVGLNSIVYIYGPDVFATAVGEGNGTLKVILPQGIEVREGNLVIVPTLPGKIYGRVNYVENHPTQPEQYAYVNSGIQPQSLRFVAVSPKAIDKIDYQTALSVVSQIDKEILTFNIPTSTSATTTQVDLLSTEQVDL